MYMVAMSKAMSICNHRGHFPSVVTVIAIFTNILNLKAKTFLERNHYKYWFNHRAQVNEKKLISLEKFALVPLVQPSPCSSGTGSSHCS